MPAFRPFVIAAGMIVAAATACSKPPDLGVIRSVCLVVEQRHPEVGGGFRLPIEERLRTLMDRMGLEVQEAGSSCDARLTVSLTFDVFAVRFTTYPPKTLYNGSKATGEARLEVKGFRPVRERLYGRQATSVVDDDYGKTSEIVYREVFEDVVAETLVNIWGEPAVIALLEGPHDYMPGDSFLRMFRERLLSEDIVVPALISALGREDAAIRTHAMKVLRYNSGRDRKVVTLMRRKDGIVDLLLRQARTGNPDELRRDAAGALGDLTLEPDRVVPALISLLAEQSSDLRVSAMVSLGQYGPEAAKAVPMLEAMLRDGPERLKWIAREALEKIRRGPARS